MLKKYSINIKFMIYQGNISCLVGWVPNKNNPSIFNIKYTINKEYGLMIILL